MSDLSSQDLQVKLAFLERHIEEQDKVVHALHNALDKLDKRVRRIEERAAEAGSESGNAASEERPPHY